MWNRRSRALLSGAVAVVVGIGAGWWQWSDDDSPSDQERIAALAGVASVEYDPVHPYLVTLDAGLTAEQVRDVLTEAVPILESSDDSEAYPEMFVVTETAEYYVDLSGDLGQTATVIATTEAAGLAGADIDFDEDSLSQLTFPVEDGMLARARHLLSNLDRAGVDDLTPIGAYVELWSLEGAQSGDGPLIEIDTSPTDVAVRRLDTLAQTLQRSDAELLRAQIGTGDQVIEVAVPYRARVDPTARVFAAAYGERHLDLRIDSGPQPPEG